VRGYRKKWRMSFSWFQSYFLLCFALPSPQQLFHVPYLIYTGGFTAFEKRLSILISEAGFIVNFDCLVGTAHPTIRNFRNVRVSSVNSFN
jgi:hypothetical protein